MKLLTYKLAILLSFCTLNTSIFANDNDRKLPVRNAISPNGDNLNSYFVIEGITNPENLNNEVHVYNRWGVEVFSASGYDGDLTQNIDKNLNRSEPRKAFKGISDGRATFSSDQQLPAGTYFYTLVIKFNGAERSQSGYIYLN